MSALGTPACLLESTFKKEISSNYKTQQITKIQAHEQMWLYSALMSLSHKIGIG
jgi:hypothetical protein